MSKGIGGHHAPNRGATNEWYTPPHILEALGPFDDDPAMPGKSDGLCREWRGFVWCNPPYGPEVEQWLKKLAEHRNGIALIFARTETRWFKSEIWEKADSLLFIYGRLTFYKNGIKANANSGAPSVLVGYGAEATRRLENCNLNGAFCTQWKSKKQ